MDGKVKYRSSIKDDILLDGIHYTGNKGPCFGIRHLQVVLMAVGGSLSLSTKMVFSSMLIPMTNSTISSNPDVETYTFDNSDTLLSAAIWSAIPFQLVSGHFGKKYGPKWLILGSWLLNYTFFLLIPVFAKLLGSNGVLVCRIVQGAALGIVMPLGSCVSGCWVPPEERSTMGFIGAGGMVVIMIVSNLATTFIAKSDLGWPWVCYSFGMVGFGWCVIWAIFGAQRPATHSGITAEERKYIETTLSTHDTQHIPTPWLKIFKSIHFWAIAVASLGTQWTDTMLSTEMALFLFNGANLKYMDSTTIQAIAPLVGCAGGLIFAPLSDFLVKRKLLSVLNARRIFHGLGQGGTGILLIVMTCVHSGNVALLGALLSFCNIFILIFNVGGAGINALDISPVFASIISGVTSTLGTCLGAFVPKVVHLMVDDEANSYQWRSVFFLNLGIAVATSVFFIIFATDKRQEDWEMDEEPPKKSPEDVEIVLEYNDKQKF